MRKSVLIILILIVLSLGACRAGMVILFKPGPTPQGMPTAPPDGSEWVNLLDGEHAEQWENITDDKDIFEITDDGILHIYGRTIYPLRYVAYMGEKFENFELHLEFKVAPRANSGLFLRMQPNDPINRGFEVQVLEDHGKPPDKHSCGAIYDVVTPMFNMSRPPGEWNSYDITVRGDRVQIVMNGWQIIDTDFAKFTEPYGKFEVAYANMDPLGHIAFQDHGGEAWYRNVLIKPLDAPE